MHVRGAERIFVAHQHEAAGYVARAPFEILERAAPEIEHLRARAPGGRGQRPQQRLAGERRIVLRERETRLVQAPAPVAHRFDARRARGYRREPPLRESERRALGVAAGEAPAAIAKREEVLPEIAVGGDRIEHMLKSRLDHVERHARDGAGRFNSPSRRRPSRPSPSA